MPTGYTAGIVDGKTKTFRQFAMLCMRAFGACIHLRDTSMSVKYTPDKVSKYHLNEIAVIEHNIAKLRKTSDKQLVQKEKKSLKEDIERYEEYVENARKVSKRLLSMKQKVENWKPPTTEHNSLKKFMLEQLDSTIEFDGRETSYIKELERLNLALSNIDPVEIRRSREEMYKSDLEYHSAEYNKEVERVNDRNKWVQDLLKSLK